MSTSDNPGPARRGRIRSLLAPVIATSIGVAILVGLGVWQLQRLGQKEALIARIEARVTQPPVKLPPQAEWPQLDPDLWEYRHVELSGVLRHNWESRVYTVLGDEAKGPYRGPGYWIVTPLVLDGGGTVLVNRGFVPVDRADPSTRAAGQVDGPVTISGLLRPPERGNAFTPDPEPLKSLFFIRDPAVIGRALGLPDVAPFTIDADKTANPGGLPQGGETVLTVPNNHMQYALTWFGMALALLGVFGSWARGHLARDEDVRQEEKPPASI